jgi:hypothetical protein
VAGRRQGTAAGTVVGWHVDPVPHAGERVDAAGDLADAAPQGAEQVWDGLLGANVVRGRRGVVGLHDLLCDEVVEVHGLRVASDAA